MAQQYYSTDYFSTDYFSTDYWLGSTAANVAGFIASTLDNFGAGSSDNFWSQDYFSLDYFSQDYFGVSAAWTGSFFVPAGFNGIMPALSANFTAAMVGSAIQNDIFDVTTTLGVNWTDYQYAASNGTVGVTADSFTLSMVGTSGSVGGVSGFITQTTANFSSAILGAVTAPPNESGFIAATASDFTSAIIGQSLAINARSGTIVVTAGDAIATWRGTADVPHYSATIANQLPDFTGNIQALLFPAGTRLGVIGPISDDFTANMVGSSTYQSLIVDGSAGIVGIKGQRIGSTKNSTRIGSKRKTRA